MRIKDGFVYKLENNAYVKLNEYYLNDEILGNTPVTCRKSDAIYTVPEDHYFVLGDNELQSTDSGIVSIHPLVNHVPQVISIICSS